MIWKKKQNGGQDGGLQKAKIAHFCSNLTLRTVIEFVWNLYTTNITTSTVVPARYFFELVSGRKKITKSSKISEKWPFLGKKMTFKSHFLETESIYQKSGTQEPWAIFYWIYTQNFKKIGAQSKKLCWSKIRKNADLRKRRKYVKNTQNSLK